MSRPRLFLRGGVQIADDDPIRQGCHAVELATCGSKANVNVQVEDLVKKFAEDLSPRLADLLDIAAYVYAADCATLRSGVWTDGEATESWTRDLKFVIPVEDIAFWTQESVSGLLHQVLHLLSDDTYEFIFVEGPPKERYEHFQFGDDEEWPFHRPERVIMFSGGLDSLAGAVETAAEGKNLVLVSHRPISTQSKRQTDLFGSLKQSFPSVQMIHIPVWVNKDSKKNREPSQRTRSFLFSALGAIVANSVRAEGVRFYENGVVSLNFPVADEVIGARASRTTHPQALKLFAELYSKILGSPFAVDNPFLFKTKTEVIEVIRDYGKEALIRETCSCAHQGMFQSKTQWHCGTCSQCIDRRLAILAAGLECSEDDFDYVTDVLTGERKDGYEKNMAVNYARYASELNRLGAQQIATRFSVELARAVRPLPNRSQAAERLVQMYERHAESVQRVITDQIVKNAGLIYDGTLPESSMLCLVLNRQHLMSSWRAYAERITRILSSGLPPICQKEQPANELRLQEIYDGLLKAADLDLVREYPFMKWGSNMTKPDWSKEELRLWVEAKYVRRKEDVGKINEAIAADITKYGDSQRRVLFVVYDPKHLIVDDATFRKPIESRPEMLASILR